MPWTFTFNDKTTFEITDNIIEEYLEYVFGKNKKKIKNAGKELQELFSKLNEDRELLKILIVEERTEFNPCKTCNAIKDNFKNFCSMRCASKHPNTLAKAKKTNQERYGRHYSKTTAWRDRTEKTNIQKYGTKNPFRNKEIKEKIKQKHLERYGVDHPSKRPDIKEKIRQGQLKRWHKETPEPPETLS